MPAGRSSPGTCLSTVPEVGGHTPDIEASRVALPDSFVPPFPRVSSLGAGDALPILEGMTVFALLAGIAIGVALGYLMARNRLGTAAATATERARAAQERAALLERAANERT